HGDDGKKGTRYRQGPDVASDHESTSRALREEPRFRCAKHLAQGTEQVMCHPGLAWVSAGQVVGTTALPPMELDCATQSVSAAALPAGHPAVLPGKTPR